MIRLNRKKLLFSLVALTLLLLGTGVLIGQGMVQAKPDTYEELKTFTEALDLVKRNYVEEPNTRDLIQGAIRGMLSNLDPHSSFMTERAYKEMGMDIRGEFQGVGIQISIKNQQLTVISPIEDTPAERAGIQAGDKILKINDEWTKDMSIEEAVDRMRGPKGTQVRLLIFREGFDKPRVFTITRDVIKIQSVKTRMLDGDIGYLKITQFQGTTGREVQQAMAKLRQKGMMKLVLDLRNNPGGVLDASVDVSGLFLPQGSLVVYLQGRNAADRKDYFSRGAGDFQEEPVVVLVNAGSASASEIVAGALQDARRAVILGTTTFGKGSVQTVFPLEGNVGMRLTTAKYYTPGGRSIQNVGIKPDLEVKLPAVKEPRNGDSVQAVVREKDLHRHLRNETVTDDEQKPDHGMEDIPLEMVPKDEKDDVQLQKAVELLKSGDPFKGLPAPARSS